MAPRMKRYWSDHAELARLVGEVKQHLTRETLERDTLKVTKTLGALIGKLKVHLAMEDQGLYTALQSSPNQKIRDLSHKFQTEMAGLKPAIQDYSKSWLNPMKIRNSPEEFLAVTNSVIKALEDRMHRENTEFYPLVENS